MNQAPGLWTSWNGLIRHSYRELHVAESSGGLSDLLSSLPPGTGVRAIGTGQSSSDIVAGTPVLLDMRGMGQLVSLDPNAMRVRVQAGMLIKDLMPILEEQGWMIPCLPDNNSISIGGAIATGTHGTSGGGLSLGNYMVACRLVKADGEELEVTEDEPLMDALRVSLGLLGIMTEVTLQCEPARELLVREEAVPDRVWLEQWPQWLEENYFLRILWLPHTGYGWVIKGNPIDGNSPGRPPERSELKDPPWWIGQRREVSRFLYRWNNPAFSRLSNRILKALFFSHRQANLGNLYRATVTQSRSSTLELAEWTVEQTRFTETARRFSRALTADRQAFAHIPMDVRFLKKDDGWLSNAHGRDTVTLGCVTRNPSRADQYRAFDIIEDVFLAAEGRPHWAKHYSAGRETLAGLYPRWDEFIQLRRAMDPENRLLNPWLAGYFS